MTSITEMGKLMWETELETLWTQGETCCRESHSQFFAGGSELCLLHLKLQDPLHKPLPKHTPEGTASSYRLSQF